MQKIEATNGDIIDFYCAVNLMGAELREQVHAELCPCTDQEFYNRYCELHSERYGEEFYIN